MKAQERMVAAISGVFLQRVPLPDADHGETMRSSPFTPTLASPSGSCTAGDAQLIYH